MNEVLETNAEDWNATGEVPEDSQRDAGIVRCARSG